MKPYFASTESVPEKDFIKMLENPKNSVKWWFKNGESDKKYFAVKYTQKYNKKLFGGIIIFKDGSCRYNDNENYDYDNNDLSEWKFLKI